MSRIEKQNYNIKPIENGYLLNFWLGSEDNYIAFGDWDEAIEYLKENPPRYYEQGYRAIEFTDTPITKEDN
jgi:hypothetical protein